MSFAFASAAEASCELFFSSPSPANLLSWFVREIMFPGLIVLAYACSIPSIAPNWFISRRKRVYRSMAGLLNRYGFFLFLVVGIKKSFNILGIV